MKAKKHADTTFVDAARDVGAEVRLVWERHMPSGSVISGYLVNGRSAIVVTYENFEDRNAWDVFTAWPTLNIEETIKDALERCGCEQGE